MRALGRDDLPPHITLGGRVYRHVVTVKHDFWAATGFYEDDGGTRVVYKIGRTTHFIFVPMKWVGRWLRWREVRFYKTLADLPNVPAFLGTLGAHRVRPRLRPRPAAAQRGGRCPTGTSTSLLTFSPSAPPPDRLRRHEQAGEHPAGRRRPAVPHRLPDQLGPDDLGDNFLNRWWLRRLQREDGYHVLKHKRRMRPDEMTAEEAKLAARRSALIRVHRWLATPYFKVRRLLFRKMSAAGKLLPEGSG